MSPFAGRARGTPHTILLCVAFAAVGFMTGRLWSVREVREARRQAGLAEQARLESEVHLNECRNALVLEHARDRPAESHAAAQGNGAHGCIGPGPQGRSTRPAFVRH